ncbi:MAG: stage II sporulation protein R [Bacillota bacterium]
MKRKLLAVLVVGLVLTGLAAGVLRERAVESYNSDNLIRIHIIPNSDDPVDQALKHKVRRAMINAMAPEFQGVRDVRVARRLVDNNLDRIGAVASREVAMAGKDYGVQVYHGRFDFPVRTYGDLTLPAGEYEAVRVVLGAGKGQNWWCVLFPPLCMVSVDASDASVEALAGGEGGRRVQFRSRLWEMAQRRLGLPVKQVVQTTKDRRHE